jgi:hypothetical protein
MKISELFGGFLKAAADAGIAIEADAAITPAAPQPPVEPAPTGPIVSADTEALKAQFAEQQQALAAAQVRIATMEQDARTARFTALASGWHGDTAGHLTMLELCATDGGEGGPAFIAYVSLQAGIAETLRQNKVFSTVGSDRAGEGSAWATVESRAKLLVSAQPSLTIEKARIQVIEADGDLYRRYEAERQGR